MKYRFWIPALAVLLVACGPSLASRRSVNVGGIPTSLSSGLSCASLPIDIGVPPQISKDEMKKCQAAFTAAGKLKQATILEVTWDEHGQNIITDTVHDGQTMPNPKRYACPILYWYPRWKAAQAAIAAATTPEVLQAAWLAYANEMLKFMRNKHHAKQPGNCHCVAKLAALGITGWE